MGRIKTQEQRERYSATRKAKYAADPELRRRRQRETAAWREKNPEHAARLAEQMAEKRLAEAGFTLQTKSEAIAQQGGVCAICGTELSALPMKRVHADHCHKTKTPRGVLCHWCNTGLGGFKDDPERLQAAITYLEKHSG